MHLQSRICYWIIGFLLVAANWPLAENAIDPACECVFFDGFGHLSNGTFMSPDFPEIYEPDTHCVLYTFVGRHAELIELTFTYFQLQDPDENNKCLDYVKLYQDLVEPAVNEQSMPQEILCGSQAPPSKTYYSRGRALIFEFHSDSKRTEKDKGFIGEFRFLHQSDYLTDGEKIDPNSVTDYHIHSHDTMRGKLFSPDFPYFYPSNKNCHFWLTGREGQVINITMVTVDLSPYGFSCVSANDSVAIYDGPGPRLGYGDGPHSDVLLGHYCGKMRYPSMVTTSAEFAFIKFKAGPNSWRQGRGFHATYLFKKESSGEPHLPTHGAKCGDEIVSSPNNTYGVLTSLNFPDQYPINIRCRYRFRSRGIERVQLIFTEFDLFYSEPLNSTYCDVKKGDYVSIYVNLEDQISGINIFCGRRTPLQVMSSKNLLDLYFVTNRYPMKPDRVYRGFSLKYVFTTNFGIKKRDGQKDPAHVCGVILRSTEKKKGTIYSPNYPGYYPKNIDCHYTFYGRSGEKVRIVFTYFDVEGVGQCDNSSSSDYLEFSNYYNTIDLKLPRYCGEREPPPDGMESESDFFTIKFITNPMFDGTGFFGHYQFILKNESASLRKVKLDNRMPGRSTLSFPSTTVQLAVLLIFFALR